MMTSPCLALLPPAEPRQQRTRCDRRRRRIAEAIVLLSSVADRLDFWPRLLADP